MKKIINLLFLVLLTASFTSCLKDQLYKDEVIGHQVQNQKVIEMAWPNSSDHERAIALDIVDKDTSIKVIPVRLASGVPADRDITITLDTSLTSDYIVENIEDNDALRHFNSAIGTLESGTTVTIPKGSNEGYAIVKLNSAKFNPAYQYVLGYSIAGVSPANTYETSATYDSHVVLFSAKNKYDGHYSLRLTTIGWAAFGITDNVPTNWPDGLDLVTTGASTNSIFLPYTGNILQPGVTPSGYTQFGNAAPLFTFDATTNKLISVINRIDDSPRGRNFKINPAAPATHNVWDPAKKTLTANYLFVQPGRPDMNVIMELKYTGSR